MSPAESKAIVDGLSEQARRDCAASGQPENHLSVLTSLLKAHLGLLLEEGEEHTARLRRKFVRARKPLDLQPCTDR